MTMKQHPGVIALGEEDHKWYFPVIFTETPEGLKAHIVAPVSFAHPDGAMREAEKKIVERTYNEVLR